MKILYLKKFNKCGIACAGHSNVNALRLNHTVVGRMEEGVNVVIHHQEPMAFVESNLNVPRIGAVKEGLPAIGYCVVEGDKTREDIVPMIEPFCQLWTPSKASRDALIKSGATQPVYVIPHILESTKSLHEPVSEQFTVLSCAHGLGTRKGLDFGIQIFQKAFPAKEFPLVRYVIKTRSQSSRFEGHIKLDPRISVITYEAGDMHDVYNIGHVLLSPHLAGAFELHVAEAAAYGMPVIASATGGVLDYLDEKSLIPISEKREFSEARNHIANALLWDVPDVEVGAQKLRDCYDNYLTHQSSAHAHSHKVLQHCDQSRVAELMNQALSELPRVTWQYPSQRKQFMQYPSQPRYIETCGNLKALTRIGVHSHRRSGTHVVGNMITAGWNCAWLKSHDLDAGLLTSGVDWIHVVRNPIDCIYKNWRWWTVQGNGANNQVIHKILGQLTFEQFLEGEGGRRIGWNKCSFQIRDNLKNLDGYFYDPLRYWADHTRIALSIPRMPVVVYERLLKDPAILEHALAPLLKEPKTTLQVPVRPVGHSPNMDHVGHATQFWSELHLQRLEKELIRPFDTDKTILNQLGFVSLEDWINTGSNIKNLT